MKYIKTEGSQLRSTFYMLRKRMANLSSINLGYFFITKIHFVYIDV